MLLGWIRCARLVARMGEKCIQDFAGKSKKKKERKTTWDICVRWDGNQIGLKEINVGRCDVD